MGDEAVVVGVRVRPFNAREKGLGATCCVTMDGATTQIKSDEGKSAKFAFDASFWSHDSFTEDEKGYCHPNPGSNYADQSAVYNQFGKRVLDNAWAGYHTCLFAYGQTGAGKSYSMIGDGANKGIVPVSCEELFSRIRDCTSGKLRFEVLVSMVEIYNDTVQDLLLPAFKRDAKGLPIRESRALGIYVEGVVRSAVDSYEAIETVIDQGASNRQVGSTKMNATSSRSHMVITIEFKQIRGDSATGESEVISNINLVDLAGSEKSKDTGATGDTLKEGNAINKSLSALGNVISRLADKATGKCDPKAIVPYRDSKLTRLLQNALGGSSKTTMICAISPASANYDDTLSTLRYADRAKKIKNTAYVNENPLRKLLRELKEENDKLKTILGAKVSAGPSPTLCREETAQLQRVQTLRKAMNEYEVDYSERLAEARERERSYQRRMTRCVAPGTPCLMNINEDVNLTGKLKYQIPAGRRATIKGLGPMNSDSDLEQGSDAGGEGSAEEDEEAVAMDIELTVTGVLPKHATITNIRNQCFLKCHQGELLTWINGVPFAERLRRAEDEDSDEEDVSERPKDSVPLRHSDRVVFGRGIFIFCDPREGLVEMVCMAFPHAKARTELPAGWKYEVGRGSKHAEFYSRAAPRPQPHGVDGGAVKEEANQTVEYLQAQLAARDRSIAEEKRAIDDVCAMLDHRSRKMSQVVAHLAAGGDGAPGAPPLAERLACVDQKFKAALAQLAAVPRRVDAAGGRVTHRRRSSRAGR
uniref:Kinesin motor domain-containing protein n=1 Tax=Zooxanthella nutricula TaxID=1333877 RepID=A0A7S2LX11_9DINO|mmetsp:Transcript_66827/g.204619  ORF Transcript_66827/g.204619 Transcript_66827/m.204619 type:complete len:759 (+) Transcript_66827:86-2362(+)